MYTPVGSNDSVRSPSKQPRQHHSCYAPPLGDTALPDEAQLSNKRSVSLNNNNNNEL